ncbi:MAG: division/cell wall cluster transcriptional repressor MraZ [Desulfobacteraceae bacterium]|nr:division/cell wall cluster transcriptional repressor MraZ [Pseudomonadota bacterium]MBU4463355.1 division/cell wall cluster transcriptional repressor MraZ [Pseudomonadota bacterium]MCG2755001.1 division/cell wall cluster transcriptional repressor MraZ [Desulfobacteraceae bacterium]
MFRGSSYNTIDSKGRVIIPARFRDVIKDGGGDGAMVTRLDGALFAYTFDQWSEIESKILSLAQTSEYMRRFRRVFIGGASDCICDKQGRILIPPVLRQYAGLEKEIVLVGQIAHFEIWSKERYEREVMQMEDDMKKEDVGNEIAKLGL